MAGITYDAGMLVAADRGERIALRLHQRALQRGIRPTVPAGVLGQVWRGGPQPNLSRLLQGCEVDALSELGARSAGAACAVARTADVVDASVVVGALQRDDLIITSEVADITNIVDALGQRVAIQRI